MRNRENISFEEQSITLLAKLGYQPLSVRAANALRDGDHSSPLLGKVLEERIRKMNRFEYEGKQYPFSEASIQSAISGLEEISNNSSAETRKKIFNLISLGRSFEETIGYDKKSFTLKFIDWANPDNNLYHLVAEFPIGDGYRAPKADVVLFVNGIPLVVIEFKLFSTEDAIQQLTGQSQGGGRLFRLVQLLIAATPDESKYGTPGSPAFSWSLWQENTRNDDAFWRLIAPENRLPLTSDRLLYSMCRPQRLLELIGQYLAYSDREGRFARFHQYAAVEATLQQLASRNMKGKRVGGIISHVQGSGRTLTMLLLARNLLRRKDTRNARIFILTDRMELAMQIVYTFEEFAENIVFPDSARQLSEALKDESIPLVAATIQKMFMVAKDKEYVNDSTEVFILIDELHRMRSGAFHHAVHEVFPNACYIGFTQLPLSKESSMEAEDWIGKVIHSYSMEAAIIDHIALPVLYEIRKGVVDLDPWKEIVEREGQAFNMDPFMFPVVVRRIVDDISTHYNLYWKGSGLKAMLLVKSQSTAVYFQEYFDKIDKPGRRINAVTLIAADYSEGQLIQHRRKDEYGGYILGLLNEDSDKVELIIVVDKFLSGFHSPRLSILYIARPLPANYLLQAIAKINRPFPGKKYGIVVDYGDNIRNLEQLTRRSYSQQLSGIEEPVNLVVPVRDVMQQLKKSYRELERMFSSGFGIKDIPSMAASLGSDYQKADFLEKAAAFDQGFRITDSTEDRNKVFTSYEWDVYRQRLDLYRQLAEQVQRKDNENSRSIDSAEHISSPGAEFAQALQDMLRQKKNVPLNASMAMEYGFKVGLIVEENLIRDWKSSKQVQSRIENQLEDVLLLLKKEHNLSFTYEDIDALLAKFMEIALARY